jgi:hypothetical protein
MVGNCNIRSIMTIRSILNQIDANSGQKPNTDYGSKNRPQFCELNNASGIVFTAFHFFHNLKIGPISEIVT